MRVLLPTKERNQAGARLRPGAVLEAAKLLGLTEDVTVKWANGLSRCGCHRLQKDGSHVVTLSTYLPASDLGRTLWHELCHAHQHERGDTQRMRQDRRNARTSYEAYRAAPHEEEARSLETFDEFLPLAE